MMDLENQPELVTVTEAGVLNPGVQININVNSSVVHGSFNNITVAPKILQPSDNNDSEAITIGLYDPIDSFVGREDIMCEIQSVIQDGGTSVFANTIVVVGMGGVGKTETVRQFIKFHLENKFKHIIWFESADHNSINSTLKILAEKHLHFPVSDCEKELDYLLGKVYNKLCKFPTILVFNNAESFRNQKGVNNDGIERYLPKTIRSPLLYPLILVTTRKRRGWGDGMKIIDLKPFVQDESKLFLKRKLENVTDFPGKWLQLAEFCGNLPVALQYAAALINYEQALNEGYNISDFLNEMPLLNFANSENPIEDEYPVNLNLLWTKTFEKLQNSYKHGKTALDTLHVVSFLSPTGIPQELMYPLLNKSATYVEPTEEQKHGTILLVTLSLITARSQIFTIHRLLQEQCYKRVLAIPEPELVSTTSKMSETFAEILEKVLTTDSIHPVIMDNLFTFVRKTEIALKDYQVQRIHFTAAKKLQITNFTGAIVVVEKLYGALLQTNSESNDTVQSLTLKTKNVLALIRNYEGRFQEALEHFQELYNVQCQRLGEEHPDTLDAKHNLAMIQDNQGNYDTALSTYKYVNDLRTKTLGAAHPDTLNTKRKIATVYEHQGKYEDALKLCEEAHTKSCQVIGADDPNTLSARHDIARYQDRLGKSELALQIYQQVYEDRCRILGIDHPDTLRSRHNIALLYAETHEPEKALEVYQEIYQKLCKIYGPENPEALQTWHNIAYVLDSLKRFQEALEIHQKIHALEKSIFGEDHPESLISKFSIGTTLQALERFDEAMEVYKLVYVSRSKVLGPNHPLTVATQYNIAGVFYTQEKYSEAIGLYEEVWDRRSQVLGVAHPETLKTRYMMATVYNNLGRYQEALTAYEEFYDVQRDLLGEDHPESLACKQTIAAVQQQLGDYDEALTVFEEVLERRSELLGPADILTLDTKQSIASVYHEQSMFEEALLIYNEVYEKRRQILGENHEDTLDALHQIANVLYEMGKKEEALEKYQKAYGIACTTLGELHTETLTTRSNIALVYESTGRVEEALETYEEVYKNRSKILGPAHPRTLFTGNCIAQVYMEQQEFDQALQIYNDIYDRQCETLGEDHSDAMRTKEIIAQVTDLKNQVKPQPSSSDTDENISNVQSIQEII